MSTNGAVVRLGEGDLEWLRGGGEGDRAAGWFFADHPNVYELEKAHAGVHFLLTGTRAGGAGPLSFLANDAVGERVAWRAAGGPGRVLDPAAVATIADAIESVSVKAVRERLGGAALAAIEPFTGGRQISDDDKEWLLAVLQGLMTFLRKAANDGVWLLVAAV